MKKLLTKILGITAGLAMAIGVGAGIALSNNEKASPVHATTTNKTPATSITTGKAYLVTAVYSNTRYYLTPGNAALNAGNVVATSIADVSTATSAMCWTFTGSGTSWTISANNYYLANTNTNNGVKTQASSQTWTSSFGGSNLTLTGGNSRKLALYQNSNWRCYTTDTGVQSLQIYEFDGSDEDSISVSLNKTEIGLDLNGSLTSSLTATAIASGGATTGLTASSDNPSVADVSTSTPTSGEAFTITAEHVGTAHITVKSSWDEDVSASCTVTVIDTTPRMVNFKKVDSLSNGQKVLITTIVDGDYYYLPSTKTGSAPTATSCEYNATYQMIENVDINMAFTVTSDSSNWQFTNPAGDFLYLSGNDNDRVRVGNTSQSFTVTETTNGHYIQSTSYTRYLGIYNKADWRCYTSRTAANYKGTDNEYNCDYINFWVEAKTIQTISGSASAFTDQTVALTSNATSPIWSIVAGDTTAEGADITEAGVVSVTGAGSVKVKAVHDDYEDAYFTITFTVRPSEPFITPGIDSTSGYSGQSETVSFVYDHLTGALSVESDDSEVVTTSNLVSEAGSGSVKLNFVGAGTTDVKFYNGDNPLATIEVTVTASEVTITGLASTGSLYIGRTLDLGSTITVTSVGIYSDAVTWESEDDSIATVTPAGVVEGISEGTVDIIVSSDAYPSATMTCTVTVSQAPLMYEIVFGSTQNTNPSDLTTSTFLSTYSVDANVSCEGISKVYGTNNTNMLKMGSGSASAYITLQIPSSQYITKVEAVVSVGRNLNLEVQSGASGSTKEAQNIASADTYVFDDYLAPEFSNKVTISTSTTGAIYLTGLNIYYSVKTAKEIIEHSATLSSLSYSNYTKVSENNYTFTDLCIRFGCFISQDLWDDLDDDLDIRGYGVILSSGNAEIEGLYNAAKDEGDTVEEALDEFCDGSNIRRFYTGLTQSKTHPAEATTEQKEYMGVDTGDTYYIWTLGKGISSEQLTTVYNVVAYIIVDDDIVFLDAAKESTKTLAASLISAGAYEEDAFGGSLKYLKDLSVLP